MKKILLVSAFALILSACSTSNQISITKSRYGNGVGISFGEGISKDEQAKIDHKREVIHDRAQHKRFIQSMSMNQRSPKMVSTEKGSNKVEKLSTSTQEVIKTEIISEQTTELKDRSAQNKDVSKVEEVERSDMQTSHTVTKKELRAIKKKGRRGLLDIDDSILLLIIIALILPPLAMLLYDGVTTRFWISLLLFFLLVWIGSVIYTLYVILSEN